MAKVFLVLALIAVSAFAQLSEDESAFLFKSWARQHGKSYHHDEAPIRYNVFKQNLKLIAEHNAAGHSWTMAANEFADMTHEEFKAKYLGFKMVDTSFYRSLNSVSFDNVSIPTSVDWTTAGKVTPVKNQGQCGSCWAFSTTGSVEGAYAIKTGTLKSFSEQQLVDCSQAQGNQGCNGGLMDQGFQYIQSNGICTEDSYPYTAVDGTCKASSCTSVTKLTSWVDVAQSNEDALQAAVAVNPVSVAIEADQSGFQFYSSGVFSGTCGTNLDHGVLAVGYGNQSGQNFWKVKNSWGASWGLQGYILLVRGTGSGKPGQCGIAMAASYPTL